MGFTIRIEPSGHCFEAEAGETVLDAALRQGLTMRYGCREGVCEACKGNVLSGHVDHGDAALRTLSDAERAAGAALFCCAVPGSDLVISAREARLAHAMVIKTLPARVEQMTLAAPDVMIIQLKLPGSERLTCLAGQYVDILLKDGSRRAFSLANPPHADGGLQLHIRRVPGGSFTEHVFTTMQPRDLLRINGPHGSFFLREDSQRPMLLVAGGTGFAPIKAVVEQALFRGSGRAMHLYWGGRRPADLYLRTLAESWAHRYGALRFTPVLSDPAPNDGWTGRTGLVHAAAMQDFPDLSGFQAYVCGSPAMVAAARRDFVGQCGLPEDEFIADSFEFAQGHRSPPTPTDAHNPG